MTRSCARIPRSSSSLRSCRESSMRTARRPLSAATARWRWLRERLGRARDGDGRLIALTGEPGMGKTRLAAELAGEVHRAGCAVLHAAGAASSEALVTAIGRARDLGRPALLVIESAGADGADGAAVRAAAGELGSRPILVLLTADDPARAAGLDGAASLALGPLDVDAVACIAAPTRPRVPPRTCRRVICSSTAAAIPARSTTSRARGRAGRRAAASRRSAVRAAAGRNELRTAEAGTRQRRSSSCRRPTSATIGSTARERVVCPFKGLASFDAADAAYFFGRERLVAELVARAVGAPLLGCRRAVGQRQVLGRRGGAAARAGRRRAAGQRRVAAGDRAPRRAADARAAPSAGRGGAGRARRAGRRPVRGGLHRLRDESERAAFIDALVRDSHAGAAWSSSRFGPTTTGAAPPTRRCRSCSVPTTCSSGRCSATSCVARSNCPRSTPDSTSSASSSTRSLADVEDEPGRACRCCRPPCWSSGNDATATGCAAPPTSRPAA